jgi:predicted amidohydrolase YtcJ
MRWLNRLGATGAIDAGSVFQNYPEHYEFILKLTDEGSLTIRLAYSHFTQKPTAEMEYFLNWTRRRHTSRAATISSGIAAREKCRCSRLFRSRD